MKKKIKWAILLTVIVLTLLLVDANLSITHAAKGATHIAVYNIVGIALIALLLVIALRKRK